MYMYIVHVHVHVHVRVRVRVFVFVVWCRLLSVFLRAVPVAVAGCCGCCVVVVVEEEGEEEETNRTVSQLTPSAVSLKITGSQQLHQVKRMIGGIGNVLFSTYSQTYNV